MKKRVIFPHAGERFPHEDQAAHIENLRIQAEAERNAEIHDPEHYTKKLFGIIDKKATEALSILTDRGFNDLLPYSDWRDYCPSDIEIAGDIVAESAEAVVLGAQEVMARLFGGGSESALAVHALLFGYLLGEAHYSPFEEYASLGIGRKEQVANFGKVRGAEYSREQKNKHAEWIALAKKIKAANGDMTPGRIARKVQAALGAEEKVDTIYRVIKAEI